MAFSAFCAQLGTPLNNPRSSWCAYAPARRRAVFTAWADNFVDGRYIYWRTSGAPHHTKQGAKEMHRIIKKVMQDGSEVLGVLCYAKDPNAETRKRARYVEDVLLVLQFKQEPEGIAAYVVGEVPTQDAMKGPIESITPHQNALDDLGAPPPGVKSPERVLGTARGYRRDDAVRNYVVERARGKCEHCGETSFLTADGTPYLEAHHIINLANQGPDTIDNVIALCPAHHREAHYGMNAEQLEAEFIAKVAEANKRAKGAKRRSR